MIDEAQALALLNEVNPVPDLESYQVSGADIGAHLATVIERSSEMTQLDTNRAPAETKRGPKWRLIAAVAAAIVLTVAVAGAVTIVVTGSNPDIADTPTTTIAPNEEAAPTQEVTDEEALEVVDRYWAAYNAGDFATVEAMFTPDAVTEQFSRTEFFAWIEQYRAWNIAQGSTPTDPECNSIGPSGTSVMVMCSYENLSVLHEAIGAPAARISITMAIGADGIHSFWYTPSRFYVVGTFQLWMEEHHPDVALEADWSVPITLSNSVEEAQRFGSIRTEYAEQWAAYLEANGCTYEEVGC